MKKKEKLQWILSYIKENGDANVLDANFQEDYIENCKPNKTVWHMLDFNTAPELGRYLSELYNDGMLSRVKISLGQKESWYIPSYIYSYRFIHDSKLIPR